MMHLVQEKEESKKKIILAAVVSVMALLSAIALCVLVQMLEMETWLRIVLIGIAVIEIVSGIAVACVLDLLEVFLP